MSTCRRCGVEMETVVSYTELDEACMNRQCPAYQERMAYQAEYDQWSKRTGLALVAVIVGGLIYNMVM
jgi:hypothetical protein